jgi:hypothetical protein
MERVGGSAGFADRTAYGLILGNYGMSQHVYAGKEVGVQTFIASPELIRQYIEGIGD